MAKSPEFIESCCTDTNTRTATDCVIPEHGQEREASMIGWTLPGCCDG
jgi:hypothetical protein